MDEEKVIVKVHNALDITDWLLFAVVMWNCVAVPLYIAVWWLQKIAEAMARR